MKNKSQCGIIGSKSYLKVLEESDLEKIFHWKNNYKLTKLIKAHPLPIARYEIEDWFKTNQSDKNQILWGIYEKKSDELIGVVRLMFIDWVSSVAEFGIFIGDEEYSGKGIGKEVLKLALDFAFKDINLHRIHLKVTESNKKAINLYASCGLVKEGLLREHFWQNGKHENIIIMGILNNEHIE